MTYTIEEMETIAKVVIERPGGYLRHFMKGYLEADEEGRTVMEPAFLWFVQRHGIHDMVFGD